MERVERHRAFLRDHPIILAPMAGVTDCVARQLAVEQGASLTFTEMVSAKGLSYGNGRTEDLLELAPNEEMVGVQLFGHEPDTMADQARRVEALLGPRLAVIDINMGCPARKIVTKGDGASLMQRPDEAAAIVEAVSSAVSVPVTVKFRRGWDASAETAPTFAALMERAGASGLTVHGRFATQLYRGNADWDCVGRVVDAVRIPVVGNGDLQSGDDCVAMREQTGCEAVMIARASEGNPWLFAQARAAWAGLAQPEAPSTLERIAMMRRHARLLHEWEPRALVRMRKHACWYCHGMAGATAARGALNACTTLPEFEAVFDELERRVSGAGA